MSNLQNPIRIYDSSLNLVSELDDYQSAYFTRSWYGIGDFSIQINNNMVHAADLQKGRFVMFGKDAYRFGLITSIDQRVDQDGKGSEILTASGFEVKFIYSWRIVLPPTGIAYYTINNSAETVMKTLIKDQCGATADADRRFALQTIATDADRGDSYVLSARYNSTIADELQKISMATNVGYYVYLDSTNKKFVFDIALGVDRTAGQSVNPRAIFSKDFDTLKSASFTTSDNQYRNYAYVAGQGVGELRTVRELYNTTTEPTDMTRKEIYVDARDLTTTTDLDARADQKLGEYAIQLTVDGAPLNKSQLVYRTDYDLGDIITISALNTSYDARITSVKESWAPLAYDIDLTFDKEPASLPQQVNRAVESVRANLSATELKKNTNGSIDAGTVSMAGIGTVGATYNADLNSLVLGGMYAVTYGAAFHFPVLESASGELLVIPGNANNCKQVFYSRNNTSLVYSRSLVNNTWDGATVGTDANGWMQEWNSRADGNYGQPPEPKTQLSASTTPGYTQVVDVASGATYTVMASGGKVFWYSLTYGQTVSGVTQRIDNDGTVVGTASGNMKIVEKRIS